MKEISFVYVHTTYCTNYYVGVTYQVGVPAPPPLSVPECVPRGPCRVWAAPEGGNDDKVEFSRKECALLTHEKVLSHLFNSLSADGCSETLTCLLFCLVILCVVFSL